LKTLPIEDQQCSDFFGLKCAPLRSRWSDLTYGVGDDDAKHVLEQHIVIVEKLGLGIDAHVNGMGNPYRLELLRTRSIFSTA
jgi:hypothetical protein